MRTEAIKRLRWRRVRRIAVVLLLLIVAVAAVPFVFTTSVVRWALARTDYARFHVAISHATLAPGGELILYNLRLSDPAGEEPLLSAERVRATFSWIDVFGGTVREVRAEGTTVHALPAILKLAHPGGGSGSGTQPASSAPSPASPTSAPFWCDALSCEGTLQLDPAMPVSFHDTSFRFRFTLRTHGDRMTPTRDMTVSLRGTKAGTLSASVTMTPTVTTLSSLTLRGLHATVPEAAATRLFASLPAAFHQELAATVTELHASAVLKQQGIGTVLHAAWNLRDGGVSTAPDAAAPFRLQGFSSSGSLEGPPDAGFLTRGAVHAAEFDVGSLTYGKNRITGLAAPLTLIAGELEIPDLHAGFAGGDFTGNVRYFPAQKKLDTMYLAIRHLDQKLVAQNLAPDKLAAEGAISGTVHLSSKDAAITKGVVGNVDLTTDGPGRIQIKDQQAAEALAQKLETKAAPGILPANFNSIVVAQLKDYPYTKGHIVVTAPDGAPVVALDYTRLPLKPGEAGYGVKTTIAGQSVLANYAVQLPGLTIALKGKSITELLALAAGFGQELAGEEPRK